MLLRTCLHLEAAELFFLTSIASHSVAHRSKDRNISARLKAEQIYCATTSCARADSNKRHMTIVKYNSKCNIRQNVACEFNTHNQCSLPVVPARPSTAPHHPVPCDECHDDVHGIFLSSKLTLTRKARSTTHIQIRAHHNLGR